MGSGEAAADSQRPQTIPAPREKGKTVTEPQETQQEKQARWEAQRIARDQEQRAMQAAAQTKNHENVVHRGSNSDHRCGDCSGRAFINIGWRPH